MAHHDERPTPPTGDSGSSGESEPAQTASSPERRLRVLLVDDDETTLRIAALRLSSWGYEVEARSEAIGTTNAIRAFEPDAVVLDVVMPAIGGTRLAKLIVGSGARAKLVLFSSIDRDHLAAAALELGAAGFVHKDDAAQLPVLLQELLKR